MPNKANEANAVELEITNTSIAQHVVHDSENKAVIINPGESRKIELFPTVAKKMQRASEMGSGPFRVGEDAKRFQERLKFDQEAAEKEAQARAEREEETNKQREKLTQRPSRQEVEAKQAKQR